MYKRNYRYYDEYLTKEVWDLQDFISWKLLRYELLFGYDYIHNVKVYKGYKNLSCNSDYFFHKECFMFEGNRYLLTFQYGD